MNIVFKVPNKEEYDAIQAKWQLYDDVCVVLKTDDPLAAFNKLLAENKKLKERAALLKSKQA